MRRFAILLLWVCGAALSQTAPDAALVNGELAAVLQSNGFTGTTPLQVNQRIGRSVNYRLANLGRLLFFDKILDLHNDNSCAGCHTPQAAFGDTQSIAIGVQSNDIVGPGRAGPRNQRRSPALVNDAFYPKLMWNGRFFSASGDPFDNSKGFVFPLPEGTTKFPAKDPIIQHLLQAQAHMPSTELTEAAGYTGTKGTLGPEFDAFDDGKGDKVPAPDRSGSRNEPIRQAVLVRLYRSPYYQLFADVFPEVANGAPLDYTMVGRALAEFQFTLVFANSPLDQFARGDHSAMTPEQKRGALLFFGKAGCVQCHAVAGKSNEMFSDFNNHRIGVPQLAPAFGVGKGNVIFDGLAANEDYGAEQISDNPADRYAFRTSPLRNVGLQPAFFHDGAFTSIYDAIAHHLNAVKSATNYNPFASKVAADLTGPGGPVAPLLKNLDPLLDERLPLSPLEFEFLVEFVRDGLTDPGARPYNLCKMIPDSLPSGMSIQTFQGCAGLHGSK